MAARIGTAVLERAESAKEAFEENPARWLVRTLLKAGTAFLLIGLSLGTFGYFLKAAATAAANNESNVLGNIGVIFQNLRLPTFVPSATGTAPLSASLAGIQNFAGDAWSDIQAAGGDIAQAGAIIGTLGEDVGMALADIAKAFLAFVMHFPDILWNGLVWAVGGAVADILNWLFPWLVIIGVALLILGMVLWGAAALWQNTVGAAWHEAWAEKEAALRARASGLFRTLLRVKSAKSAPEAPETDVGNGPPTDVQAPGGVEHPTEADSLAPEVAPPEATPEATPEVTQEVPAAEDLPLQEPPRQEELEATLGDGYTEAKDRMRAAIRTGQPIGSPTAASA
jgi:uncharacterized membrane protein